MNYSNYTSSHSHGSEKWVPQAIFHFQDYGRNGSYFKVTSDFKLLLPASPMELLAGRRILPRLRVGGSGACCRTTPPGTVTAFQWLLQVRPQKRSKQGLNDLVDQKTPDTGFSNMNTTIWNLPFTLGVRPTKPSIFAHTGTLIQKAEEVCIHVK